MLNWKIFLIFIWFIFGTKIILTESNDNKRQKRFLIFPRQAPTRHQFIGGIGIPADLNLESLTIGYVLKTEYYLPYNATVFRENPFLPEYTSNINNTIWTQRKMPRQQLHASPFRWAVYQFIADRLESYGYNGQECMLKAICEAKAFSFERHYNVFAELMHIFLSPRSSHDLNSVLTTDYFEAESLGYKGEESCEIYNCNFSLLNLISKVFKV